MASGQNFVFYAKEQVWLVICVGNRSSVKVQDQRSGMRQKMFERLSSKEL